MKTITTIAASMMLMATTASAAINPTTTVGTPANTDWVGTEDVTVLPDMCKFTTNTNGTMDLDTASPRQDWSTTTPAQVTLAFRDVARITVEADDSALNQVGNTSLTGNGAIVEQGNTGFEGTFDADVTYVGSTMTVTYDGTTTTASSTFATDNKSFSWTSTDTGTTGTPDYTAGVAEISIAGKATPTTTAIYDAGAEYRVTHKVTCLQ